MRFTKLLLASLSFFAITACASTPKGSSDGPANILTAEEISKANVPTAYEAVDRLRRRWFRDMTGEGEVTVYMNNQKQGDKEYLRQIPAQDVASLEYLKGSDAIMRFGQEARGGAIIINRK
jgi:hypothetical protein